MASFKDLEEHLKTYLIQEQSDAHNVRTANIAKYNNIKLWVNISKYQHPHFFVRISISEAAFALADCSKLTGGLGYEERFIYKWFGRAGIKEKLRELWNNILSEQVPQDNKDK